MGNRPSRVKNQVNIQESKPNNETNTQRHTDQFQTSKMPDENIYVTPRSVNGTNTSFDESEIASSVIVSDDSISNLSARNVQPIIRESANNVIIKDSNNTQIGDNINCYGPVSIVNTNQSNVQIINQPCTPIVHDFGELHFFLERETETITIFKKNRFFLNNIRNWN